MSRMFPWKTNDTLSCFLLARPLSFLSLPEGISQQLSHAFSRPVLEEGIEQPPPDVAPSLLRQQLSSHPPLFPWGRI